MVSTEMVAKHLTKCDLKIVDNNASMNWTGTFTLFATSGYLEDTSYYDKQMTLFHEFLNIIPDVGNNVIHCANSDAALMRSDKPFFNMVRVGMDLYGNVNLNNIPIPLQRA